jgi:hypothetical protein
MLVRRSKFKYERAIVECNYSTLLPVLVVEQDKLKCLREGFGYSFSCGT